MSMEGLPKFEDGKYPKRITVPVSEDVKQAMKDLRAQKINFTARIRELIERELKDLGLIK